MWDFPWTCCLLAFYIVTPGARFSKAPETFRARKTISVSQYLKQRCVSVLLCPWMGRGYWSDILSLFLVTAAAAAHDVSPSSAHLLSTVLLLIPLGRPRFLFPPHVGFGLVPYLNALIRMHLSAFTYIPHTAVHQDDAVIPAPWHSRLLISLFDRYRHTQKRGLDSNFRFP